MTRDKAGAEIVVVPYRSDNYGFIIHLPNSGSTIAIDAGDLDAYLHVLDAKQWTLGGIFLTHHHNDHRSHLGDLATRTGARVWGPNSILPNHITYEPLATEALSHLTYRGIHDTVDIKCLSTPGHTLDMLNYYIPEAKAVFTGDTLFTLGCGRLFEGTPEMMFESIQKLKSLPADTMVYGAHEYALSNLEFALSEFPTKAPLRKRAVAIRALRAKGKPTVPSLLSDELATNPFLLAKDVQEFARLRAAKDVF